MAGKISFFGVYPPLRGRHEIELTDFHGMWARELFAHLLTEYPGLSGQKLLFSLNQQYSTGEEIIRSGDEIAIFTAVSGG